jgi:CheY-like chemotaxis protein
MWHSSMSDQNRHGQVAVEIGAFIVDDHEDMRVLIRTIIEAADFGLFVSGEAADAEEAIEAVDDVDPEVILMDEMMPGMSGLEAAALILRRRPGQRIILCSAYLDADLRDRAEAAGIEVCLTKSQLNEIPAVLRRTVAEGS